MKKGENEQQKNEQNVNEDELELDENQIIETILALGNEIWKNFGQEEEIEDVQIFFQHQFYIHCFQMAYPDFDFSKLLEGDDEDDLEKMSECIQALIDLLSEEILLQDMNHIKGEEIVQGNPEHCINLLQILQQISQACANQDGEDSNDIQLNQNEREAFDDQLNNYPNKKNPNENNKNNQQQSNQKQKQNKDSNSQERFENLNFKNKEKNFFSGEDLDNNGAQNINKQQFLDNLDDDIDLVDGMNDNNTSNKKQYNKRQNKRFQGNGVGNVGDALGQELDIEFDEDIQQKLNGDEQNKQQIMDGEEEEEDEQDDEDDIDQNRQIIDHNDVNIIDNGQDFQDEDQYNDEEEDDEDDDGQQRNLNRQTKNIANLNDEDAEQIQNQNEDEGNEDMYGDEILNEQNSSNFQMNNQNNMIDSDDDEGLSQLHDQLKNIDKQNQLLQNGGGKKQIQFQGISQQIIDDQNLETMYNYKDQLNDDEDEGQHYPDDGDDDDELEEGQEENENFQQLENHLQISKNQKQQAEDDNEEMNLNYDELGDIDPELLEAAQKFGLDEDGIRLLQQQMYQKAAEEDDDEEEYDDQQAENNEEENDLEGQEFAEMLNGFNDRNQQNSQQMQIQDDEDEDDEEEEMQEDEENDEEKQQILRGGQNIEEDQSQYGNERDDESQNLQQEMENKLKQLNEQEDNDQQDEEQNDDEDQNEDSQYNQDEDDEDDDQQIDIQNLNDNEKAILIQYLQDEYQKNPDSLPMSKEVIEQFLAENQDLLQKLALDDEYEKDFVSNEIIVEGENDNNAMIIQGENEEQEDQNEQNDNGIANSDEINIEGGEHNIIEDENEGEYNQENYTDQNQQDDYDNEEDQNEENEEEDEENIDPNQHQLYNAQYQNDDENNQMMINLQNQQQQFNQQQQIQQLIYFQNQKQQKMHKLKKSTMKKKSTIPFANRKSSQLNSQNNQQMFKKTSKPLTIAANKKFKRSKITVNTISHDDFQNRKSQRYNNVRMPQKSHSSKRPQTAKNQKNFNNHIVGAKIAKNLNNYMQTGIASNKIQRQKKSQGIVQMTNSTNQMIIPQQSQMFTSFGMMPHQAGGHSLSQRKTSNNLKQKKYGIYGSIKPGSSVSLKSKKQLKNNLLQKGQKNLQSLNLKNNQTQQEQFLKQQQNIQEINLNQQAQFSQNLVEMPILSEEFLNQLNEEQLQALLEQQQQLMMLQQQSQQQNIYTQLPQTQQFDANQQQDINLQPFQQENINIVQQDNQQLQQLLMLQQQQYQQQQLQQQKQYQQQTIRGRSRSKPKIPVNISSAARIPSGGSKHGVFGSGSRSKNGSKKRNQKTRSSLNVGNALYPLNQGLNLAMPQSQQVLANQVMKPQKTAAQIYSQGNNMIQNLIQNKKKPLTAFNKKGGKKRSQPNQGLANKNSIMNTQQQNNVMQAQLQAQQALYNNQNQLDMQQDMMQAPSSQYVMHNHKQYQMQIGADGQPVYYPVDDDIKEEDEQVEEDQNLEDQIDQNQNDEDDQEDKGEDYDDQEQYQEIQNNQFDEQQLLQQQKQQQTLFHQLQQQQMAGQQSNILPGAAQMSNIAEDLSTEQIIELLQNNAEAQQNQSDLNGEANFDENGDPIQNQMLPEEVQLQLQQILQERMLQHQQQQQFLIQQQQINESAGQPHSQQEKTLQGQASGNAINDRVQSYQNICNILTESVSKAKERYQHLHPAIESQKHALRIQSSNSSPNRFQGVVTNSSLRDAVAQNQFDQGNLIADKQIVKQKIQFENLLKQYRIEMKKQENKRILDAKKAEKIAARDDKIKAMKQKKFEEELVIQQRSQMFKRNAQQVRLCKKVYELASDLEKNKLLEEKKSYKESEQSKQQQKKVIVQTIESYYQDKINMLKERIESERFERQIAQEAQKKALRQMKKEMDQEKRNEVQRYIHLLQQEDDKYELQNLNLGRLENEIKKLYNPLNKKGKNSIKN